MSIEIIYWLMQFRASYFFFFIPSFIYFYLIFFTLIDVVVQKRIILSVVSLFLLSPYVIYFID